jgi:hypothetical protein
MDFLLFYVPGFVADADGYQDGVLYKWSFWDVYDVEFRFKLVLN